MDTVTYPDRNVETFVLDRFIPLKVKVKESPELVRKYIVTWTPSFRIVDEDARSHWRVEGYFWPDDFMGRMLLGLGGYWYDRSAWDQALSCWNEALAHGGMEIKAEALYWLAAGEYRKTKDHTKLGEGWARLRSEFPDSEWARRASVPQRK